MLFGIVEKKITRNHGAFYGEYADSDMTGGQMAKVERVWRLLFGGRGGARITIPSSNLPFLVRALHTLLAYPYFPFVCFFSPHPSSSDQNSGETIPFSPFYIS